MLIARWVIFLQKNVCVSDWRYRTPIALRGRFAHRGRWLCLENTDCFDTLARRILARGRVITSRTNKRRTYRDAENVYRRFVYNSRPLNASLAHEIFSCARVGIALGSARLSDRISYRCQWVTGTTEQPDAERSQRHITYLQVRKIIYSI